MNEEFLKRIFSKESQEQQKQENQSEKIVENTSEACKLLKISELIPYPNQPFKPYSDERLNQLVQSIRQNGILTPLIIQQKDDNKYLIISGHNRAVAANLAGLTQVPCIVKKTSDAEAEIILTETNLLSRAEILPSEKAFAYKMRYEAMKRQGKRTDLTSGQAVQKLTSAEQMAETSPESEKQIRRYISLTNLTAELLELLDSKQLSLVAAVNISYLNENEQTAVHQYFFVNNSSGIDIRTSEKLKELHRNAQITLEVLTDNFNTPDEKPRRIVNVKIKFKKIKQYFENVASEQDVEDTIIEALRQYFQRKEQ